MKYVNRINGSVIDTTSKLGGAWEAVKASQPKPVEKIDAVPKEKKTTKRVKE